MKDRQLTRLFIATDLSLVIIHFTELHIIEDKNTDDGDRTIAIKRSFEAPLRPASGLSNDLKSCRRHALDILGIELAKEAAQIKAWTVQQIDIKGDMLEKKSRLEMTLALECKLTGKIIPIKVPQVTMYPKDADKVKYHAADELTQLIEKIAKGCWGYLDGEFDENLSEQIVLFPREHKEPVTV